MDGGDLRREKEENEEFVRGKRAKSRELDTKRMRRVEKEGKAED